MLRRTSFLLALSALLTFAPAGCADEEMTSEAETAEDDDGKADGETELRVRTGETTLWVDKALARTQRDGADAFVLFGRASRNLTDGSAFIFDDVYGAFTRASARTFEVMWRPSEAATLFSGVDQLVRLHFVHSSSRPDTLTARVVVRPRLSSFSGSGTYVVSELKPVVSGGRTVLRVRGSTDDKIYHFSATAAGTPLTDWKLIDDTHYQVDLAMEQAIALAGAGGELAITVDRLSGSYTKRARLGLVVKKLGFSSGDPFEVWPPPSCQDDVRECLEELPAGTTDLGSCGEAILVNACTGALGVAVTDVDIQAALDRAGDLLAAAVAAGDFDALVGPERAAALSGTGQMTIEYQLELQLGTSYPDAAARDASLAAIVDAGIDEIYARPLQFVDPVAPLAGDIPRSRQVAADALLAYLASVDLTMTEFGRPLEVLCRQYRMWHVDSLRFFRLEAMPENFHAGDASYVFIGSWLNPYVELSVSTATGESVGVYFEID